ncbi:MAG: DUF5665 domain-containing protein [Bacillota bacterium]
MDDEDRALLKLVKEQVARLGRQLERAQIADYVQLLQDPPRLAYLNFLAGVARGLGFAVGATFLGALLFFFLQQAFIRNLPFIGDLIAQLIVIIREELP